MSLENSTPLLVSICMITYNHEPYIQQAVESVVTQKTEFRIELVIGEDCSTDNTRKICDALQEKYPALIKLLPSVKNLGVTPNFVRTLEACTGKYIAFCEGDDYWIDPSKLQKQVEFLEANSDFIASYHDVKVVDFQGELIQQSKNSSLYKVDISRTSLLKGRVMSLLTLCFRNVIKEYPPEMQHVVVADKFLSCLLGQYGNAKYMSDILPSGYRMHPGGVWSLKSIDQKRIGLIKSYFWIWQYYDRVKMPEYSHHFYKLILKEGYFSSPFKDSNSPRLDTLENFVLKIVRRGFRLLRSLF
jgi:glycosyltransferase involved in cell wall biosynthesis